MNIKNIHSYAKVIQHYVKGEKKEERRKRDDEWG